MERGLNIVKIGGSVLTDKSQEHGDFQTEIVERLIGEIVEAKKEKDFGLILIHGAGSYPHFLTTKYELNKGFFGSKSAEGFSRVKLELAKMNAQLWAICLKAGLSVATISASSVIVTSDGEISSFDTEIVERYLQLGITPVLHGDDTMDRVKGIAVLSGDKTMAYLAKYLDVDNVIFVSDVDGVFNKNPKVYKDAHVIGEINDSNFTNVVDNMEIYNENDASGEMKGKLIAIKKRLSGRNVRIVGGLKKGVLKDTLLGRQHGTRINVSDM